LVKTKQAGNSRQIFSNWRLLPNRQNSLHRRLPNRQNSLDVYPIDKSLKTLSYSDNVLWSMNRPLEVCQGRDMWWKMPEIWDSLKWTTARDFFFEMVQTFDNTYIEEERGKIISDFLLCTYLHRELGHLRHTSKTMSGPNYILSRLRT
jgi:hypothetical protein